MYCKIINFLVRDSYNILKYEGYTRVDLKEWTKSGGENCLGH